MLKEEYFLTNLCVFFLPKRNKKLLFGKGILHIYKIIFCWIFIVLVYCKLKNSLNIINNDVYLEEVSNYKTYHLKYLLISEVLVQYNHLPINFRFLKEMVGCFQFYVSLFS